MIIRIRDKGHYEPLIRDEEEEPSNWKEWDTQPAVMIQPERTKPRVRKPLKITQWFGEDSTTEESDSDDNDSWSEVDRRKRNAEKKKKMKRRKKEKEGEVRHQGSQNGRGRSH